MNRTRSIFILLVVTALVVAAAYHFTGRSASVPRSGEPLFPALLDRVNDIERVRVTGNDGAFSIERGEDGWVVPDKQRYPANASTVHQLLVGAAGLVRVEPKTSKPDLYPKIGVEDPGAAGSPAVRFELESATATESFVLGNRRPSKGDSERTEFYVRVGDDPQAWLVEGSLPSATKLREWLDLEISAVSRARAREVVLTHPDGEVIRVFRTHPADEDFALADMPEGHEIDGPWRVNDIGRMLEQFKLEEVKPAGSIELDGPVTTVVVSTFDGLRVEIRIVEVEGVPYATLRAEFDAALATTFDEPDADARRKEILAALLEPEAVREEVAAMNARWSKWVYQVQKYKHEYVQKRMADLTKAKEPADGPALEKTDSSG